jgi:bifunctional non-homologous end joining protein LigD
MGWIGRSALLRLPALAIPGEAIIDGEVVVTQEGRTNFSELQAELAAGRQGRLIWYAFDLLWRNSDLRKLSQIERKQALLDLLGENDIELPILYSEHLKWRRTGGVRARREVELGGHRLQTGGYNLQVRKDQSLVEDQNRPTRKIPGHRICEGSHGRPCSYLGKREAKELVYKGKVGTGWSRAVSSQIRKQLDTVVSPWSKLSKPVKKPQPTWV